MNLFKLLMFVALILTGSGLRTQAQGGASADWSFVPASSVIPDGLPDGEIIIARNLLWG